MEGSYGSPQDWTEQASVLALYGNMTPDQFDADVKGKWAVAQQIRDVVTASVKSRQLRPIEGIRILGCATAGLFGYDAFHNQGSSSPELVAALTGRIGLPQTERELAGASR